MKHHLIIPTIARHPTHSHITNTLYNTPQQSIIGSENDQRESSSSSTSATSNHPQSSKGDKNTQWGKLNHSQGTTRLGLGGTGQGGQGLGGGGGGGGGGGENSNSMTSSYGMVSTYYADGSPITQNDSRPASSTMVVIPQGAKLFPMAPPSLPVAPPGGTSRSSFFERRSSSGTHASIDNTYPSKNTPQILTPITLTPLTLNPITHTPQTHNPQTHAPLTYSSNTPLKHLQKPSLPPTHPL